MPETTKELLAEVRAMSLKIDSLDRHISISQDSVKRLKVITFVGIFLVLVAIASTWTTFDLYRDVKNGQTALCENRNESAKAAKGLWTYILDVSEVSNPKQTKRQKQFYADMRGYLDEIYAERDCAKPGVKYPLPAPPAVPSPKS